MDMTRAVPPPPPPPAEPMPPPGCEAWARWHLRNSFRPDDAVIIEWLTTWERRYERVAEYAQACHVMQWAGWQATLAWNVVETLTSSMQFDDDIPF